MINKIIHGDCLEVMKYIADGSIDMILCDLPYGTTACKWDTVIPFGALWEQYKRIIKPTGVIALTGSQPFTSMLIMSNIKWFKYELIWEKNRATGFFNANNKPLRAHENIVVFSSAGMAHGSTFMMQYNPQMTKGKPYIKKNKSCPEVCSGRKVRTDTFNISGDRYPKSILRFSRQDQGLHPTQKPVDLFEWLIKTYSNEGETVLDNCIGSGTTAVACILTGRNFIGIEQDAKYHAIACKRVQEEYEKTALLDGAI